MCPLVTNCMQEKNEVVLYLEDFFISRSRMSCMEGEQGSHGDEVA